MSPHRILGKKTHEEAFIGRSPNVEHINIFGCLNYSHVPSKRRTKLDPTTQQGIINGYSRGLSFHTMLGCIHLLGIVLQLERGCLCIRFICFM
jgi:hypothetical protein